jgi:6-phosphofructo-2-kinase/fructose-2,6-biphosphatase 4
VPADYYQNQGKPNKMSVLRSPLGEVSQATIELRHRIKTELEEQIWDFFTVQGGQVVIYDANNGNVAARRDTMEQFAAKGVHVIFLESLCDKDDIITANIRSVKLSSPDYAGWDADRAVADYWKRIRNLEAVYETVTADEGPYIKIMNVGERIDVNRIEGELRGVIELTEGYLQTRCCFFLMNIHTRPRTIFFARVSTPNPA